MMRARLIPILVLAALVAPAEASGARSLSIGDATTAEPGGTGTTDMTFTVTLSQKHKRKPVLASFSTAPGSATPSDYEASAGQARIKPGKTRTKVKVPIRGDLFSEPDETFTVELSEPVRATIADGEGEGLIPANDDGPDGDGDDIPDIDDCAPADPNPPGALLCYVPTTIPEIAQGNIAAGTNAYLTGVLGTARSNDGRRGYGAIVAGDPGYVSEQFSAIRLDNPRQAIFDAGARHTLLGTTGVGSLQIHSSEQTGCCESVPAPISVTPAALAAGPDGLNGVLVKVDGVSIDSATRGEWLLDEAVAVNDRLFSQLPGYGAGASFESITGHASTLGAATPSLSPRFLIDIDPTTAILLEWTSLDTCLQPGEQNVIAGEVQIDEAQASDTVIALDADNPGLIDAPDTVTIPAGNTSAPVEVDAVGSDEGFTELTATLDPFKESLFIDVGTFC